MSRTGVGPPCRPKIFHLQFNCKDFVDGMPNQSNNPAFNVTVCLPGCTFLSHESVSILKIWIYKRIIAFCMQCKLVRSLLSLQIMVAVKEKTLSMNNKQLLVAVVLAFVSVLFALSFLNVFKPWNWKKAGLDGDLKLELLPLDGVIGPESIAFDANGEGPYTGVSDGRILKWQGKEAGWFEYAAVSSPELLDKCRGSKAPSMEHLCGRPLGLQFSKTGELYIADAYLGLLKVSHGEKFATPVVTQAEGLPFRFTNSLDIDKKSGAIYFTESSKRFQRREFISAVISGDKTGRLMKFNPESKEIQVLLDNLSFPNGVALSEDGSFLLFSETNTCRVLRYWLQTQKAKTLEVVAELSGFPDNISRSPRGGFWVGLHSKRRKLLKWFLSIPWLQKLPLWFVLNLQKLSALLHLWGGEANALRLSEEGDVLEVLEGIGGRNVRFISEVVERNGSLWIGSFLMHHVGIYYL